MGTRDDLGRLHRAPERAAVDGADGVLGQTLGQASGLEAAVLGKLDADGPGEAILGRELGGAVADEIEAGGRRRHLQAGVLGALPPAAGGREVEGLVVSETAVSHSRIPPRIACALLPMRTPAGTSLSFFVLPPPSIT
jgi:hypothetical protein